MVSLKFPVAAAREKIQKQIDTGVDLVGPSVLGREESEQKWFDYNVALLENLFDDRSIATNYAAERNLAEILRSMDQTNDLIAGRRRAVPERPVSAAEHRVRKQLLFLESLRDRLEVYPATATDVASITVHATSYVESSRLDQLRALSSKSFDLSRLIRLAEELNDVWQQGSYHAVIMLLRAIMDHVPPVFGFTKFGEVANNYSGLKSFKEAMATLDAGARKIADLHLHTPVRSSEVLPNATQVNFAPQLDLLLSEVVRILKAAA